MALRGWKCNIWSDTVLGPAMRPQIYADFIRCIDSGDRDYFPTLARGTGWDDAGAALCRSRCDAACVLLSVRAPLERTLSEQAFLAGEARWPMPITSSSRCSRCGRVSAAHATCCPEGARA